LIKALSCTVSETFVLKLKQTELNKARLSGLSAKTTHIDSPWIALCVAVNLRPTLEPTHHFTLFAEFRRLVRLDHTRSTAPRLHTHLYGYH